MFLSLPEYETLRELAEHPLCLVRAVVIITVIGGAMKNLVLAAFVMLISGCQSDADKLLGSWECKDSIPVSEEEDKDSLGIEMSMTVEYLPNGHANSFAVFSLVYGPNRGTAKIGADFIMNSSSKYELKNKEICEIIIDVVTKPVDEMGVKFEKEFGGSISDLIPKGISECSRYTLDGDILVLHDDESTTTCSRVK